MAKVTVMIYTALRERPGISKLDLDGRTVREVLAGFAAIRSRKLKPLSMTPKGTSAGISC